MQNKIQSMCFGYPKIGQSRELKKALESYWKGSISKERFLCLLEKINAGRIIKQQESNIDLITSNDFSYYDFILDLSTMLGVVPERFLNVSDDLDLYFSMARGNDNAIACEMTKWFDTNYHYIVPEITHDDFILKHNKLLEFYQWAKKRCNIETIPDVVGPYTFLKLAKGYQKEDFKIILDRLCQIYNQIFKELEANGVKIVQIEEPAFVLDISESELKCIFDAYKILTKDLADLQVYVLTYYEALSEYNAIVNNLPVQGIGLDFVVNNENMDNIKKFGFPEGKKLIAGVVSGRDVWKTHYEKTVGLIEQLVALTEQEDLIISNSCPLFHLPVSLEKEKNNLNKDLIEMLAFADERLIELQNLKEILNNGKSVPVQDFGVLRKKYENQNVQNKMARINESQIGRKASYYERYEKQKAALNLPLFPTTTIGSYPQTKEVRKARSEFKKGVITSQDYEIFIRNEIKKVIELQDQIGLDVLVHGEFERTDMVEHFGQKLDGFAFTKNGWVQSYGSRCVRPPIIYADVSRPEKMTVDEIVYAQSLTEKTVKGMLTGPVTILNWSFFRKDIPKKEIAFQIALALKDEIMDLENADIKIIQIDEAAFREGMPLRKSKQKDYLNWAVNAFRLSNEDVKPEIQIHTHMCYSEFNEILESIYAMDSDVISIEASRSGGEIISVFEKLNYDHGIGLGVYDIHSPRIPFIEEIEAIIERSIEVIDKKLFWINPDCGLKTRDYPETIPSLKNMVKAAHKARGKFLEKQAAKNYS